MRMRARFVMIYPHRINCVVYIEATKKRFAAGTFLPGDLSSRTNRHGDQRFGESSALLGQGERHLQPSHASRTFTFPHTRQQVMPTQFLKWKIARDRNLDIREAVGIPRLRACPDLPARENGCSSPRQTLPGILRYKLYTTYLPSPLNVPLSIK